MYLPNSILNNLMLKSQHQRKPVSSPTRISTSSRTIHIHVQPFIKTHVFIGMHLNNCDPKATEEAVEVIDLDED
jgi:hypothetical protein